MAVRFPIFIIIIGLCVSARQTTNTVDHPDSEVLFVPTSEWRVIKEGQKIPKGIHVRINLQTGLKEGKTLDGQETQDKAVSTRPKISFTAGNSNSEISHAELKEAMKNVKDDYIHDAKRDKNKFRSYLELTEDLRELNLTPRTDMEILKELLAKFKAIVNVQASDAVQITQMMNILEDLEYLVHQYDNANEFVNLNGFDEVILKNLNATNLEVKKETLKLLGTSMQNNVKVQVHALEKNCVGILLRILALHFDNGVKNRAIFALSGLLRHFPLAQLKFIQNGGLDVLTNELEVGNDFKVKLKMITLINDLLVEFNHRPLDAFSKQQYEEIGLKSRLKEHNWCEKLSGLLRNILEIDGNDYDGIEKCLDAIISILDVCDSTSYGAIKESAYKLELRYGAEHNGEEADTHIVELCREIVQHQSSGNKIEL